jgi:hypothetical protein
MPLGLGYSAAVPGPTEGRGGLTRAALQLRERVARDRPPTRVAPRTAILVVNGFDRHSQAGFDEEEARRFPWIRLCLKQLERYSGESEYQILVWDNSFLPEHLEILEATPRVSVFSESEKRKDVRHGRALDRLLHEVPEDTEYVVTLDTDSFPIRDGWLENLTGRLDRGAWIAGVWRDEMAPRIPPYVHPSCLAARRETLLELGVEFARKPGVHRVDVGQNITNAVVSAGGRLSRLRRSNARNMHFLMGGVYADLVYHHGAGNRRASFWTSFDTNADDAVRIALRDAAFADLQGLVDFLTGNGPLEEPSDVAPAAEGTTESTTASTSASQTGRSSS